MRTGVVVAGLWAAALSAERMPAQAPSPAATVELIALGDLRGEIKPCGCSPEGQMGGLPRRLTYLADLPGEGRAGPVRLDLGNNLPLPSAQGELKRELIQRLMARMPPDAILPGPNELATGLAALDTALPWVVSNDSISQVFQGHRAVQRGASRIGLYGYLSPDAVYQGSQSRFRLEPAGPALFGAWRSLRAARRDELAVLLFRGSDQELAQMLDSGLFHLIVAGNPSDDELVQVVERSVAGRLVPQVPTKGQGALRIRLGPDGTVVETAVDWLTDRYREHPDAIAAMAEYDERVKQLFLAQLEQRQARVGSPFAGQAACAACHGAAHRVWAGSRHANALASLVQAGKQFDPECLACHVVGLDQGGFLSGELTPQLAGVQCENCHGPARAHLANPLGVKPVRQAYQPAAEATIPESLCRICHHGSHSPTFSFGTYWPKISH